MTSRKTLATGLLSGILITPVHATVHYVGAGQSLQAAIDAAVPDDTINLQAGAEFRGSFHTAEEDRNRLDNYSVFSHGVTSALRHPCNSGRCDSHAEDCCR